MPILLKDKPIYEIRGVYWDVMEPECIKDHSYWDSFWSDFHANCIVNPISNNDYCNKIKNATTKELKEGSKLYFSKNSKFPRFKIKDTSFKRVIKIDKSDCVVIHESPINFYIEHRYILEGEECYYVVQGALPCQYRTSSRYGDEYAQDWYGFLKRRPFIFKENATPKILYEDVTICYPQGDLVYNIMTDQIKAIITDTDLDTIVSKSLNKLNKDDFFSIRDLLKSPDKSSVGLGLRLLTGYDISDVKTAVKVLLQSTYYACSYTPEWNSVAVKQLRDKYILSPVGTSISSIRTYLMYSPQSDLDKELCGIMLKDCIEGAFKDASRALEETINRSDYDIKISVNVE